MAISKRLHILLLALLILAPLCLALSSCQGGEGPAESFIISYEDIPDAYKGERYDLNSIIIREEGTAYSAEVYMKGEDGSKIPIEVSDFSFVPPQDNVYIYAVITATKNGKAVASPEVRIRCYNSISHFTVPRKDVPDAYSGFSYDVNGVIIPQEGVTYSARAYRIDSEGEEVDVPLDGMSFLPAIENSYVYVIVTAAKGDQTLSSEAVRIRVLGGVAPEGLRQAAYVGEEYDVKKLLYSSFDLPFEVTAYYKDGDEKEAISVSGQKVLPTVVGRNFFVEITAKRGGMTYQSVPIEVQADVRADAADEFFYKAWNSSNLVKAINKVREFVKEGNTSVRVSNPTGENSTTFSTVTTWYGFWMSAMSVTDWSNAVLAFWVYNDSQQPVVVGVSLKHAGAALNISSGDWQSTVEPGEWALVAYSLRAIGITTPFYFDPELLYKYGDSSPQHAMNDRIGIYVKGTQIQAPYAVYFDGFDICDYDYEKFGELNTKTPDEIFEEMPGELEDKYVYRHIVREGSKINGNYAKTLITPEILYYNQVQGLPCPPGVSSDSSFVKYNVTPTAYWTEYNAALVSFSTAASGVPIKAEYLEMLSVTDWSNAYVGFWVYNDSDYTVRFFTSTPQNRDFWGGVFKSAAPREWTYIEFSLRDDFAWKDTTADHVKGTGGITENIFERESYTLKLFVCIFGNSTVSWTTENWQTFNCNFYIDKFDIYNQYGDSHDIEAKTHVLADTTLAYRYYMTYTVAEIVDYADVELEAPIENSNTLVKYEINGTGNESNIASIPILFTTESGGRPISKDFLLSHGDLDWANAYIGFWIYNATGYSTNAYLIDSITWERYAKATVANIPIGKWTYVEFKLSYLDYAIDPEGSYTFGILLNHWQSGATYIGAKYTYYIDGLDIYNKAEDEEDTLLRALMPGSTTMYYTALGPNMVVENPCPDNDGSTSSVKYDWSYSGVESSVGCAIRLRNVSGEFINSLSIVKENGDWANAYIGFWIYNDTEYSLRVGAGRLDTVLTDTWFAPNPVEPGEWAYVEIKLSNIKVTISGPYITSNLFEYPNYDLCINVHFLNVPKDTTTKLVFYIDGFDIYSK